jgi:RND family efflux transporter MFP subunit
MKRFLIINVLTACMMIPLTACDKEPVTSEVRLRSVKTITVGSLETDRSRTFSGVSKSSQETRMSFKVTGSIDKLPVSVGDRLKSGQLIAQLDDSIYQLQAQQTQADLARAKAEERNASSNYQRVRGLYENNNASKNELDATRAAFESSKAQVNASQRALQLSRLNISYTRLKATEACSVASISIEISENVTPGQEVAMVTCGDSLEVELSVPESIISLLTAGQSASVKFDTIPDKIFESFIKEVGITSIGGSTFPVTIAVNEKQNGLRSGMAAQVQFKLPAHSAGNYTIPVASVGEDQSGRFVFLVKTGQDTTTIVSRQTVTVGELTAGGLEITSGLSTGDKIVTAGLSVIHDGMRVKAD